jgi:hypothetical protein
VDFKIGAMYMTLGIVQNCVKKQAAEKESWIHNHQQMMKEYGVPKEES